MDHNKNMKDQLLKKEFAELPKQLEESRKRELHLKQQLTELTGEILHLKDRLCRAGGEYQAIFEHANDAILLMKDGVFVACNNKAQHLFGWKKTEIIGLKPLDLSPELQADGKDSATHAEQYILQVNKLRKTQFEWRHLRKDGSFFDADVSLSRISLKGELLILAIVRDISERKKVRKELESERAHFEHLFQGIPEGIVLLDKDDKIIDCNHAFEDLFQYKKEIITGEAINDLIVPDHLKNEGIDATKSVAAGKPIQFDTERKARDGSLIQVSITGKPIDIAGGQTAVIGVYRNITELKRTERRLHQEKEKFIKIVETSPGVICSFRLSPSGAINYPYATPEIENIYGFKAEQLAKDATPVRELIHPDDLEMVVGKIQQSAKHLEPLYGAHRYLHPGKGIIWVETRMIPELDADGGTTWYGYVLDVTGEKERELREQVLREITLATLTTTDLETLINKIRIILEQLIDTTNFYIALYNKETNILSIPYERDQKDNIESWPAEKSVTGIIVTNKKPLLLQKPAILALMDQGIIHQVGNMCEVWLGVPLLSGSEVIGALVVQDYNNPNSYNKESQTVLEFVSHHISMAIQRQQNIDDLSFHSTILDQIRDRVTVTDMDGRIAYINNAECNALSASKEDLVGKNVISFGNDKRKQGNRRMILTQTKDKGYWRGEIKTNNAEGGDIVLDVRSSLVNNSNGKAIGVCAISRDITEQKKTALQRDYHLRVQRLISKISSEFVGVTKVTFDLKVNYMLREMGSFFKVDRAYLFRFSDDYQKITNTHEWCAAGIEPQLDTLQQFPVSSFSWWSKRIFNKKIVHIPDIDKLPSEAKNEQIEFKRQGIQSMLAVPVFDTLSELIGFFGFDAVQTKKRWSGYQIGFLRILSNIITDAIKIIDIEQNLVQAKEKAEESDRLKSAFLANVSHEIRTPMNAILGFLSLLKEPRLDEERRADFVEIVNKSGQRLLDTINDIMELSKIEAGQVKVKSEEVDVSELMKDHFDLFLPQTSEKGLSFNLSENLPEGQTKIVTDKHKLEGIMINLINNAIKFTNTGFIEFGNYKEDGETVFYVKDSGIGISKDKQDAIFDRFVQADISLAREHEGTGLGLSIVKAYLELLKGRIWLESEPGRGSTFFFSIPSEIPDKSVVVKTVKQTTAESNLKEHTILIAEDDDASYQLVKVFLSREPLILIRAKNGEEALQLLQTRDDISLVLMDIKMPGMGGLATTRAIREFNKRIPIVAQTAHAMIESKEEAIKAGCNAYIAKPFTKQLLIEVIQKHI